MCRHEQKYCPRCDQSFECKVGSITQCQCSQVKLTEEQQAFIESKYNDCLCLSCLENIQRILQEQNA